MSRFSVSSSVSARRRFAAAVVAGVAVGAGVASVSYATPYASNVVVTGTQVNFILNENADSLTYSINGGPVQPLTPTKGAQTFNLGSGSDTFAIFAAKNDAVGYSIATGGNVAGGTNTLFPATNAAAGYNLISSDSNPLVTFNNGLRGVDVVKDPNASNFGTTYMANSVAGTSTLSNRSVGDGIYALRADQSDAFGYGDTAQNPGGRFDSVAPSTSSPWRLTAGPGGDIYVTDWSDQQGGVYRLNPNLSSSDQVFAGVGGPSSLPAGQNHGSVVTTYIEGSLATGNLKVYTIDEDLTPSQFGSGSTGTYIAFVAVGALGLGLVVPWLFYKFRKPSWKAAHPQEAGA